MERKILQDAIARAMVSRRQFVGGLLSGAVCTAGAGRPLAAAENGIPARPQRFLSGNDFKLDIARRRVDITGRTRDATLVDGSLPGPLLRWREGDRVRLEVTNRLPVTSSIHWHGVILPAGMDGVPGISFPGIRPGETFRYEFDVRQSGTYWYHSHSGFQEQTGLYGPLIIDPADPEPFGYDRDYVVLLSDWSDTSPETIYARLKKQSHYYNYRQRTLPDLWRDIRDDGIGETARRRAMWNRMRMTDSDISDVNGHGYTFLMNGRTSAGNWTAGFAPGEKIRLRFINASAMTLFDVRIPGSTMTVVAADGQYVRPVEIDEFRIGVAETYDMIVEPAAGAHAIFAQAIDRTGYVRGTLSSDPAASATVPAMDPPPVLTHADMGMRHGEHAGHAMDGELVHRASEFGPQVDMRAEVAMSRPDDPGIGLRNNGRRVLTYGDLRSLEPTRDEREPGREIELHLTGNMSRYMWSINGIRFAEADPVRLSHGERVRIVFINDTMMHHPMHLHGMWSELETGDPGYLPRKHTFIVPPGSRSSFLLTADAQGSWAWHCHLLYHMPGMFRRAEVT